MSKLSLREIAQSQLDSTPVIDGQLIVCLDTGNAYRDTATAHVKIGSDLEVVSDLPLAPLAEKLYYLKPDKLYVFLGGNWTLLNDKAIDLDESIAKLPAGSSTSLNDDVEIITQDTDITQPHYYRRKLVVLWEYIKTKAQDFFAAKNHKHGKADITDFPTSMSASDVYPWAKAVTKPSYTKAEVGLGKVDNTADADKSVKYATNAGTADNALKLGGLFPSTDGTSSTWGTVPTVATTGVTELGKYVDFHADNSGDVDYDIRLTANKGNLEVTGGPIIGSLLGNATSASSVPWSGITDKPTTFPVEAHTHDDRYYTEAEVDGKLNSKVGFGKVSAELVAQPGKDPYIGNVEGEDVGIGDGSYYSVINLGSYSGGNFRSQIAVPYQDAITDSNMYIRTANNITWRPWRKIIHSGNIGDQIVAKANSADTANALSGFTPRSSQGWGVQTGTFVHGEGDSTGGDFAFRRDCPNAGQMSMVIDGRFYQNEGNYRVLDTSDEPNLNVNSANYINDVGDHRTLSFAYSKDGLAYGSYSWLAGWNGNELRAVDKNQFATAGHTHPYLPLSGGTINGDIAFSNCGTGVRQIRFTCADNDYGRVAVGGTASNTGYMEIATADDGNESIYVRQYNGVYASIVRSATLLDENGNTSFPGSVSANTYYAPNWFRATGDSGFYFENHGGGWYMSDDTWIRAFNGKNIYTPGVIQCDSGFNGNLNGNATTSTLVRHQGNVAAISGTATRTGGLQLYGAYNNGYPATYGNVICASNGAFGSEIMMDCCGGNGKQGPGRMYYRNRSDWGTSEWSDWAQIAYITDKVASAGIADKANSADYLNFTASNEINFTGTPQDNTVYFGYRNTSINEYKFNNGNGSGGLASITAAAFNGKATTAGTADSATTSNGVQDYNDANRTINIGFAGAGLNTSNLTHVAGYTDNGTKIKDVSKDVLKSWIGLGNYLPLSGGTISGALNFANNTWNLVGDDAYMGDHNIGGSFCIMGANDTTRLALVNKDNQGDYALVEYGGGNLNFNKKLGANITGHADGDLALSGGTMSGQIIKSTGGSWIGDRDRAAIRSSYPGDWSYGAVAAMATKNGYWTIGNLGGNESLIFNYSTDANYSAGKNETSQVYLPAQAGTIITSATIGGQSVNHADSATALNMNSAGNGNSIYGSGNDAVNGPGGGLNNVVISSWYGVSFTSPCGVGYGGKNQTAVGIDCREGIVKAARFDGSLNGTATNAEYLANDSAYMRMHWNGQSGQPTWLWGGNDASNMYVYNPSNFSVNYANSAGNGTTNFQTKVTDDGQFGAVRFNDGVQICWFTMKNTRNRTFLLPFADTNYAIAFSGGYCWLDVDSRTTTGFTIGSQWSGYENSYIAIGRWR